MLGLSPKPSLTRKKFNFVEEPLGLNVPLDAADVAIDYNYLGSFSHDCEEEGDFQFYTKGVYRTNSEESALYMDVRDVAPGFQERAPLRQAMMFSPSQNHANPPTLLPLDPTMTSLTMSGSFEVCQKKDDGFLEPMEDGRISPTEQMISPRHQYLQQQPLFSSHHMVQQQPMLLMTNVPQLVVPTVTSTGVVVMVPMLSAPDLHQPSTLPSLLVHPRLDPSQSFVPCAPPSNANVASNTPVPVTPIVKYFKIYGAAEDDEVPPTSAHSHKNKANTNNMTLVKTATGLLNNKASDKVMPQKTSGGIPKQSVRDAWMQAREDQYRQFLQRLPIVKLCFGSYEEVLFHWEHARGHVQNVPGGIAVYVSLPYLEKVKIELIPVCDLTRTFRDWGRKFWSQCGLPSLTKRDSQLIVNEAETPETSNFEGILYTETQDGADDSVVCNHSNEKKRQKQRQKQEENQAQYMKHKKKSSKKEKNSSDRAANDPSFLTSPSPVVPEDDNTLFEEDLEALSISQRMKLQIHAFRTPRMLGNMRPDPKDRDLNMEYHASFELDFRVPSVYFPTFWTSKTQTRAQWLQLITQRCLSHRYNKHTGLLTVYVDDIRTRQPHEQYDDIPARLASSQQLNHPLPGAMELNQTEIGIAPLKVLPPTVYSSTGYVVDTSAVADVSKAKASEGDATHKNDSSAKSKRNEDPHSSTKVTISNPSSPVGWTQISPAEDPQLRAKRLELWQNLSDREQAKTSNNNIDCLVAESKEVEESEERKFDTNIGIADVVVDQGGLQTADADPTHPSPVNDTTKVDSQRNSNKKILPIASDKKKKKSKAQLIIEKEQLRKQQKRHDMPSTPSSGKLASMIFPSLSRTKKPPTSAQTSSLHPPPPTTSSSSAPDVAPQTSLLSNSTSHHHSSNNTSVARTDAAPKLPPIHVHPLSPSGVDFRHPTSPPISPSSVPSTPQLTYQATSRRHETESGKNKKPQSIHAIKCDQGPEGDEDDGRFDDQWKPYNQPFHNNNNAHPLSRKNNPREAYFFPNNSS